MENRPRASPRSRQQRRSGSASPEKENAARGGVPRNEVAAQLRETFGTARPRTSRSGAPLPQAVAQADGARGLLTPLAVGTSFNHRFHRESAPVKSNASLAQNLLLRLN